MPRFKRASENIPEEWIWCPLCKDRYGFIGCRVTKDKKEMCLRCATKIEKAKRNNLSTGQ